MKFFIFLSLAFIVNDAKEIGTRSFNGYQVFTVNITTPEEFAILKSLHESDEYDFWTTPRKFGSTDIMAEAGQVQNLSQVFLDNGIKFDIKIQDVERLVDAERRSNKRRCGGRISWTAYPTFTEIEEYLTGLVNSSIATVSVIGQTYEKRNIYVVKISSGGDASAKRSILIDANIHAREWISSATATWIINEFTTNSKAYSDILAHIDIYIIPLLNSDGYEYSRTVDRMWRKTRSSLTGTFCKGADPNRNFSFKFGEEGTSANPCSQIYTGPTPFSEPETKAFRDFVVEREGAGVKFYAYLDFHAYSQLWLLPWGYSAGQYPEDYDKQLSLGEASVEALAKVHGTTYGVGQAADMLYGVGGASDDWAKNHGIPYTATIEMRDTGKYGFILPASQIIPNAQEVMAALKVVFQRVIVETLD